MSAADGPSVRDQLAEALRLAWRDGAPFPPGGKPVDFAAFADAVLASPAVERLRADAKAEAQQEPPHCTTCVCGRRAPVQGESRRDGRGLKPAGTVAWWEHEKAWEPYGARHSQSAERIAERAGFGYWEMTDLLGHEPTTWSIR